VKHEWTCQIAEEKEHSRAQPARFAGLNPSLNSHTMKTILSTWACALLLVVTAWSIPQTFGGNTFARSAGASFEQFASDPAAWNSGAGLKGHWAAQGDALTLTDSAVVFGVEADQITAQRLDGQVQSFRVAFRNRGKQGSRKPVDLLAQLTANLRTFTGDSGTRLAGGGTTFKYKTITITLSPGSGGEVVAEFKRV